MYSPKYFEEIAVKTGIGVCYDVELLMHNQMSYTTMYVRRLVNVHVRHTHNAPEVTYHLISH